MVERLSKFAQEQGNEGSRLDYIAGKNMMSSVRGVVNFPRASAFPNAKQIALKH